MQPKTTARLLALALGTAFLVSCQEDQGTNSPASSQVSLAARLLVAPTDTATFKRTVWVKARVAAGAVKDSALVPFDSGHYLFKSVPPNTPYALTFTGYLGDSTTVVWTAKDSGNSGEASTKSVSLSVA